MSDDAQPVPPPVPAPQALSREFFLRVNDLIEMANRTERRYDTHHAQLVFMHGLARYSGHHYLTTSGHKDDAGNREAFADYIAAAVKELVLGNLEDMAGPAPAQAAAPPDDADNAAG